MLVDRSPVTAFHEMHAADRNRIFKPLGHAVQKKRQVAKLVSFSVVEMTGFEPAASASRTQRSTKLSHISIKDSWRPCRRQPCYYTVLFCFCQQFFAEKGQDAFGILPPSYLKESLSFSKKVRRF